MTTESAPTASWYSEVTRYQWLVLAIASAGWVFDVFEGQIFVACMNEAMATLLRDTGLESRQELLVNVSFAAFLAGGALGGVLFGMLADRWGRRWSMAITILIYSVFTGLTALAQNWWQLALLRFVVGFGVGGEWAVAAAAVAEVFQGRARPIASGIFHASSVLGTWLAIAAGVFVVQANAEHGWRFAFVLGVLPALLILWVRTSMREPETWEATHKQAALTAATHQLGQVRDLFAVPALRRYTLFATALATIGLATFWGAHIRAKDVVLEACKLQQIPDSQRKNYEMLAMFLTTTGGGLGLLSFAPLSQRLGRRPTFVLLHLAGFTLVLVVFLLANALLPLLLILPAFGFFTLAMHAGYAVYFPELFPTRLRSTGSGFCFNVARLLACPVLLIYAWLRAGPLQLSLAQAMLLLSGFFPIGALLSLAAPETRGQPLPD